jgi:hypothetical protein
LPNRSTCRSNAAAYTAFFLASAFDAAPPGSAYASPLFAMPRRAIVIGTYKFSSFAM